MKEWIFWLLNSNLNKSPIIIDSFNNIQCSGGLIIIKSNNGGVVFKNILNAKKIKFTLQNDVFCQYGVCNIGATLPNIILTGEGRDSFAETATKGIYEITVNGSAGNFFIGGYSGAQITDIKVSEWLQLYKIYTWHGFRVRKNDVIKVARVGTTPTCEIYQQ